MSPGPLIIVSGPSGSGKSTIISRLLAEEGLAFHLSVSATTRGPRPGERDGVQYHFWTSKRFEREIVSGAFLEWAMVHGRDYYGTLRAEVEPFTAAGVGVLLDIDVQGAAQVRKNYRGKQFSIFLRAASLEACRDRLQRRGTETPEAIASRLATAERELERAGEYDYQIVNEVLDKAVAEVLGLVRIQFKGEPHAG